MVNTLILVESPLQLVNAFEFIEKFNVTKYLIILRLSGKPINDHQMINLIELLNLDRTKIFKITVEVNSKNFFYFIKIVGIKLFITYLSFFLEKLLIGNYESKFMRFMMKWVGKNKIYLLDDGNKSINIQKSTDLNLFTMYDVEKKEGQIVLKNDYFCMKNIIKKDKPISNKVIFIGSGMSEIGVVSEAYYLESVKAAIAHYNNLGLDFIYIPHRAESKKKISKISKFKNVNILSLDYPVELVGLLIDFKPEKVAAFYSTAIITLRQIYNYNVETLGFNYSNSYNSKDIENVYKYMKSIGIPCLSVSKY